MSVQSDPLRVAEHAVLSATSVARWVADRFEQVQSISKNDKSPVTAADFAVQATVSIILRQQLEDAPKIVGEESADLLEGDEGAPMLALVGDAVRTMLPGATDSQVLEAIGSCDHDGTSERFWTLDPVDGTKGFLRRQQYAVSLGLIESGTVVLGVLGCPNLPWGEDQPLDVADSIGTCFSAVEGGGCRMFPADHADSSNAKTLSRRQRQAGDDIRVCESVEKAHSNQDDSARLMDALPGRATAVRLDSQCKYGLVARDQADVYLRLPVKPGYVEKIWDHAAGMIVATEAGAIVSDVQGKPLDFSRGARLEANRGVICAAAEIHGALIEQIASMGIADAAGN